MYVQYAFIVRSLFSFTALKLQSQESGRRSKRLSEPPTHLVSENHSEFRHSALHRPTAMFLEHSRQSGGPSAPYLPLKELTGKRLEMNLSKCQE